MNIKKALYRCWGCKHEWPGGPGQWDGVYNGGRPAHPRCPKCGSLYMTWLNYEKDFKR